MQGDFGAPLPTIEMTGGIHNSVENYTLQSSGKTQKCKVNLTKIGNSRKVLNVLNGFLVEL